MANEVARRTPKVVATPLPPLKHKKQETCDQGRPLWRLKQ